MKFLLDWHPVISIIFLCIISLLISYSGLKLVRKRFSDDVLRENHEVGGFIFNAFGLIYAVLVAFVVFVTWTEYDRSRENVDLEAIELTDLYHNSKAFPDSIKLQITSTIVSYINDVTGEEWKLLENGTASSSASESFIKLWTLYTSIDVKSLSNEPLYRESLRHLSDLGERRRTRIFDSRSSIPGVIWAVLLFGGFMTVIYTYFFCTKKVVTQFMMTAALTVLNTLILYMIFMLDNPFNGYIKIDASPFEYTLQLIRAGL